ncbi:MAG TPA: hypothetical protein PKA58_25150 [Polyangium sp.]|nr:hypothetical protein [Polyangium sp.]
MSGQHCIPQPNGMPTCEGPVGSGTSYAACTTNAQCASDFVCIDTGGISPCCLNWCISDLDCGLFDTCYPLNTPVFVNGVEYGVCSDFLGCN